jgi:hypothetical protein
MLRTALQVTVLGIAPCTLSMPGIASERDVVNTPVPTVQQGRMAFASSSGSVEVPIAVTRDWTRREDDVTRAIIVIHGWPRRDLRGGEHAVKAAGDAARGTIVITPQFLSAKDIAAHHLPGTILRWREGGWQKGEPSEDSAAVSSFQVVDQIFWRLADRAIFPNLNTIVLAGHSAGGQFVQRYAAIGRGDAELGIAPIHVRYVVANPATYLYFTDDRPNSAGGFAPFNAAACPGFNHWSYGLQGGVPSYASALPAFATVKARYLRRDVVYLLGTADDDPQADGLDRSCAGEAQGATRLARGLAYNAYVRMLDPKAKQRVLQVRGVGHHSHPMFSSACGLAALFDKAGCD